MKILAINNYSLDDCMEKIRNGTMPAQHAWGCDYLKAHGHDVTTLTYLSHKGRILKQIDLFLFSMKNLLLFNHYDVVISFCNPSIGWAALFRKLGFLHCKMYTLVHHHTSRFMWLNKGYDRIFFLSKQVMDFTKQDYPSLAEKMTYLEWGPDLKFYNDSFGRMKQRYNPPTVMISNGKTWRDIDLIENGCKQLNIPLIIITDKVKSSSSSIVSSGIKGKNAILDSTLLTYMLQSTISTIPIKIKSRNDGLTGLTSFLDAIALGQPIIMSDNTNISVDVDKLHIGYTYKAGDVLDFIRVVKKLIENPSDMKEFSHNARIYAETHTYEDYCKSLEYIIVKNYNNG
jgi:hypothetical protein